MIVEDAGTIVDNGAAVEEGTPNTPQTPEQKVHKDPAQSAVPNEPDTVEDPVEDFLNFQKGLEGNKDDIKGKEKGGQQSTDGQGSTQGPKGGEPSKEEGTKGDEPKEEPTADDLARLEQEVLAQLEGQGDQPGQQPEKQTTQTPQTKQAAEPTSRDLSFLSEQDKANSQLFRQMSGQAFDYTRELYKNYQQSVQQAGELSKQVESAKSGYFRNNPDAYKFTPEFAELTQNLATVSQVSQAWEQELAKLEEGEEARMIVFDEKTESYVYGDALQPSGESKVMARKALDAANRAQDAITQEAAHYQARFQQDVEGYKTFFEQADKALFGKFTPDEAALKEASEQIPAVLRDLPEVQFGLKAYAALQALVDKHYNLVKKVNDLLRKKSTAQPNVQTPPQSSEGSSPTLDDEKKAVEYLDKLVNFGT